MADRCTADVGDVRPWISLHVRDRHLRGLMAVAKQQPSPFLHSFFFFSLSHSDVFLSGVKCKGSGQSPVVAFPSDHFNEPTTQNPPLAICGVRQEPVKQIWTILGQNTTMVL